MRGLIALALAISLGISACSSGATDNLPVGDAGNAEVGVLTDDTGDTMQFGPGTELPADWPAALPIPPGELLSVAVRQDGEALGTWIIADDAVQATLDAYLVTLQESGFSAPVESEMSVPDEGVFTYNLQSDAYDATVSASILAGQSEIFVSATPRLSDGT